MSTRLHHLTSARRGDGRTTLRGLRWHEGIAALLGLLGGLGVAVAERPPASIGFDAWAIGMPMVGAAAGLALAVLRNGDASRAGESTPTRVLCTVCAAMWLVLFAVAVEG